MLKELIENTVRTLVDNPQAVSVAQNHLDAKEVFEIRVHEADVGKVIGKEGQTIRALRMLAMSMMQGKDIEITVAK